VPATSTVHLLLRTITYRLNRAKNATKVRPRKQLCGNTTQCQGRDSVTCEITQRIANMAPGRIFPVSSIRV
jgi:hypothetical protein